MTFEARLREICIRQKIMRLSGPPKVKHKSGWVRIDKNLCHRGGGLLDPVIVCGHGRIQEGYI